MNSIQHLLVHGSPSSTIDRLWRDFMCTADDPSAYVGPEFFAEPHWRGQHPFAVLALCDSKVVGVLTGIHLGKHLMCGLPSRPQICSDRAVGANIVQAALLEGLLREAAHSQLVDVFAWAGMPLDVFEQHGFKTCTADVSVVLDLRVGANALFKHFHGSRRRNISKAIRHGIEVFQATTDEDADAYYSVYSGWRKSKRKIIRSDLSNAVAREIQQLSATYRRFLASFRGKIVAATTVRFHKGGLIEYASNCSLDEFIEYRPNDLILWRTIEWACEQGFTKYSLGGSSPFKRRFGGVLVPSYRYRLDRSFLHHHNLKDSTAAAYRRTLKLAPKPVALAIRRLIGAARASTPAGTFKR